MISAARLSRGIAHRVRSRRGALRASAPALAPARGSAAARSGCRATATVARGPRASASRFRARAEPALRRSQPEGDARFVLRPGPVETGRGQRAPRPGSSEPGVARTSAASRSVYLTAIRLSDPADVPAVHLVHRGAGRGADRTRRDLRRERTRPGRRATGPTPHVQIGTVAGYWIVFTRGNTGFFLYAVVPPDSVTAAQLARRRRAGRHRRRAGG